MKRIFIKVTVFLHLPLEHVFNSVLILLLLLCLLSDEINISSAVIVPVVILILCLPLICS